MEWVFSLTLANYYKFLKQKNFVNFFEDGKRENLTEAEVEANKWKVLKFEMQVASSPKLNGLLIYKKTQEMLEDWHPTTARRQWMRMNRCFQDLVYLANLGKLGRLTSLIPKNVHIF